LDFKTFEILMAGRLHGVMFLLKIFLGFDGEAYQRNPQKAHPCMERRHMMYRWS